MINRSNVRDDLLKTEETSLSQDAQYLDNIKGQLDIVADISRADTLLYGPLIGNKTTVIAHAHPRSIAPAYRKNYTDVTVTATEIPVVIKALSSGRRQRGSQSVFGEGIHVAIEVWPICSPSDINRVIGAISIDISLIEYERHRRRSSVFRKALRQIQIMLTKGLLKNTEALSPFGEHEGLMVVDTDGHIRYASGIATNLYRKLGYVDGLVDLHLESLETQDDQLARRAMTRLSCVEQESRDGGRDWVRKAIPILSKPTFKDNIRHAFRLSRLPEALVGVLIIIRDITEERRQEQELRVKNAMIQEIHHRVKNNLQTIAALLRIQTRRTQEKAASAALKDATHRILSVAVIHEFLSDNDSWAINMKEVSQRIITQLDQSLVDPDMTIRFQLEGPSIWLPARQATACALVINELLQNAVEHGFQDSKAGEICVILIDEGDYVIITIQDNGLGLPENFNPDSLPSLGLQIANTLVTEDLQGSFDLIATKPRGTTAKITFPKAVFGGEDGWNENEYS